MFTKSSKKVTTTLLYFKIKHRNKILSSWIDKILAPILTTLISRVVIFMEYKLKLEIVRNYANSCLFVRIAKVQILKK